MINIKLYSENRRILQIAIPSIISNITVPLLGLIDVTIVGHLGSPAYIGAIAVGGMLFNIIYWIFGFLRMGTSGMTSQAYGQHDLNEITRLLLRSVGVGLSIAICLLILQYPILKLAFTFIQTTPEVEQLATTYFYICIWGAPAMLGLYGFAGWFIGMQNSRFPMYIAITQNIVNITASLCLVYLLDMKVAGVATGTLIAQYAGFIMAILLYIRYYSKLRKRIAWREIWQKQAMYRFFQVNRDIFFRTLCLVIVTMFFTSAGAAQGEIVLAVNTLLMQLFTLFSYIMDGFAYAGEALAGRYIGARNQPALRNTVNHLFYWGVGLSAAFTLLYAIGGKGFLELLTNDTSVINASDTYFYWALAIPLAGFSAFLWDGLFMAKYKRVLLKLSGESLMGEKQYGIDEKRLAEYAAQIQEIHEQGVQIGIVIGGGNIFRGLSGANKGFDRVKGDQMGMLATVINSLALSSALVAAGVKARVLTAVRMEPIGEFYSKWKAIEHMENGEIVIMSAGTGNPFFTTDTGSSLRGIEIEADVMLKGTRVDGIYTADPEKDPTATKFHDITYDEVLKRGLKVMDLTATCMCKENNLPIVVFDMDTVGNLKKVISGEEIGTIVHN